MTQEALAAKVGGALADFWPEDDDHRWCDEDAGGAHRFDGKSWARDVLAALHAAGLSIVSTEELEGLRRALDGALAQHPERLTWPVVKDQSNVSADGYRHWCGTCKTAYPCRTVIQLRKPVRAALEGAKP
jgi:hypothetical protein